MRYRFEVVLAVVFVILMTLVAIAALPPLEKLTRHNAIHALSTVVVATNEALQIWRHDRHEVVERLAADPAVVRLSQVLLATPHEPSSLLASEALAELRLFFEPALKSRHRPNYIGFFVIAPDRISVASMRDENMGTKNLIALHRPAILDSLFAGATRLIPPIPSDVELPGYNGITYTHFVAAPIRDAEGTVIAVLAIRLNPTTGLSNLARLGIIGDTGETFFFDREKWLLSHGRFESQLIELGLLEKGADATLNIQLRDPGGDMLNGYRPSLSRDKLPFTRMATLATTGIAGQDENGYRNYRGRRVLGAWIWDEDMEIGLATEMDEDEALQPYFETRRLVIRLLMFTALLSLALGFTIFLVRRKGEDALKKALEETQTYIDANPDLFYLFDRDGNLLKWNRGVEELTRLSPARLLKRPASAFVCDEDKEQVAQWIRGIIDQGEMTSELRFIGAHGSCTPYLCNGVRLSDETGNVIGFTGTGRNISELKTVHEELVMARDVAEKANGMKEKYLTLIAHDLKGPYGSLISFLQMIKKMLHDEPGNPLYKKLEKPLGMFITGGERAINMIDEVLRASSFHTGEISVTPVFYDALTIVENTLARSSFAAANKGVTIINDVPANSRLYAEPTFLGEVLQNLVSNAIKFCRKGDSIGITFFASADKQSVTLAVRDSGCGIDKEFINNLLLREVRTTGIGTDGERGTGFGLPMCAEIMNAMGGELTFETQAEEGTTFYATLKYARPRLLVVDDDEVMQMMVTSLLSPYDIEVVCSPDGRSAIERLREETVHLVLSDINMPTMDGFELLSLIKGDVDTWNIPVILFTGDSLLETRERALRTGAADFIFKPMLGSELVPRVRRYLF